MTRRASWTIGIFITALSSFFSLAIAVAQPPQAPRRPEVKHPGQTQAAAQPPDRLPGSADQRLGTLDVQAQRVLATQVGLDRAGFSPGEIDASAGGNTDRALRAFQQARGLSATGELDGPTVTSLGEVFATPIADYPISEEDVAGPFVPKIPADMMEKSKLPSLAYASLLELLAERFHTSPKLLQRLNPQARLEQGHSIIVPNVEPFFAPGLKSTPQQTASGRPHPDVAPPISGVTAPKTDATPPAAPQPPVATKAAKSGASGNVITVTEGSKALEVQNQAGETIFHAPVTVGSENDPLPVGEWKVNGVSVNPPFSYNPDLFWDADSSRAKAKIPPGPNNPVGVVWIDLSKDHYGIHGTPEPGRVGYTESHGCIRLTNWDAMRLAALVAPGTKVILR